MVNFVSYEKTEAILANFSFVFLFFSMMAYWVEMSGILTKKNTSNVNAIAMLKIPATKPVLELSEPQKFLTNELAPLGLKERSGFLKRLNLGSLGIGISNVTLFSLLVLRWFDSGHFPLSNLYESLLFLCWALTFFHLVLEKTTDKSLVLFGAILSPTALFTNAFANFSLPTEMQHSSALVPALQSNWLMMHVTVMILSYAALIFGSLLSIGFLILTTGVSTEDYENALKKDRTALFVSEKPVLKFQWAETLDNLSYRMLGIGFPLLTIGILSGAVWANEAWGSYWSWDPKETWALLTWFVFAIYLHARITKNWQGKKPAFIAAFGFFVVWVCYLGVNLLGEGLHSYGWLQF